MNATLNSYRLPHGPRPTTIPRSTSAPTRNAKAAHASPIANGAAALTGAPSPSLRSTPSTKLPPTTPANAGARRGARASASPRPLARRTVWATCAAKAPTSTIPATT